MDYSCPLCKADLAHRRLRKVPLSGETSWLALRWHLECPECKGAIQARQHRSEKAIFSALLLFAALLNIGALVTGFKASFVGFLAALALIVIGPFAVRPFVVPKDWERYAPFRENGP